MSVTTPLTRLKEPHLETLHSFYSLCDDSMKNWPVLKQVLAAYKDKGVAGILHIFPLPYVYVYSLCFACELFELVHGGF